MLAKRSGLSFTLNTASFAERGRGTYHLLWHWEWVRGGGTGIFNV
jgi:hypothetical protein